MSERDNGRSIIFAEHDFKNGVHTYKGRLDLPTPCHFISHEIFIAESYPEQVSIDLFINPPFDPEVSCVQVIKIATFEMVFSAHKDASIELKLDGVSVDVEGTANHKTFE